MERSKQRAAQRKRAGANEAAELARTCARALDEKQGQAIVILDLRKFTYVTDFFVLATGTNPRQTRAMADSVQEAMSKLGERPIGVEGTDQRRWVLVDYGDVVVHLFDPAWRKLYDLGLLWGDAPRLEWEEASPKGTNETPALG